MTRRLRYSLLSVVLLAATAAILVPNLVGAASNTAGNMTSSVTPEPITAQCHGTYNKNLSPIELKADWKGDIVSATVAGPGTAGSQSLTDNQTFLIAANTVDVTCGSTLTYTFTGTRTGGGTEVDTVAETVSDVNSISTSVSPASVNVQCNTGATNGRLADAITITTTFNTTDVGVDSAQVSGPGITGTATVSRSDTAAGATGTLTIPAGTTVPCPTAESPTFNYTVSALKGENTVEQDPLTVTATEVECPYGTTCPA
jgi:hypothetical protein